MTTQCMCVRPWTACASFLQKQHVPSKGHPPLQFHGGLSMHVHVGVNINENLAMRCGMYILLVIQAIETTFALYMQGACPQKSTLY